MSSVQSPESCIQDSESSDQNPYSKVQRLWSSVQNPASMVQRSWSRVQNPASRIHRPESSVQSPASRVQCPALPSRIQEFRYIKNVQASWTFFQTREWNKNLCNNWYWTCSEILVYSGRTVSCSMEIRLYIFTNGRETHWKLFKRTRQFNFSVLECHQYPYTTSFQQVNGLYPGQKWNT